MDTFIKGVPSVTPPPHGRLFIPSLCHPKSHQSLSFERRSPSGLSPLHPVQEESGLFFRISLIISTLEAARTRARGHEWSGSCLPFTRTQRNPRGMDSTLDKLVGAGRQSHNSRAIVHGLVHFFSSGLEARQLEHSLLV